MEERYEMGCMEKQHHVDRLKDWDFVTAVEYNGKVDLENVVQILAMHEGLHDAEDWAWLVRMKDGYIFATGWCDFSGWD